MVRLLLSLLVLALAACSPSQGEGGTRAEVPGVSDGEILLGSSLALTGHAGYLGTQTLRGAMSYLRHVNESGGVHGRKIRILALDDAYDPPKCLANTQKLLIEDKVFALFSYVGTPTTVRVLPMVEEAKVPLLGVFTGANALRTPFNRYVINIRASYYQETEAAVRHMVQDMGLRKIAVFYQFDAYGFDGLVGTELALKRFGLEPVARGSYIRGTLNVEEGLNRIKGSGAQAVVMIGTYGACAEFIMKAARDDYHPLYYTVSFVGAEELARRLGRDPEAPVVMSQVVPTPFGDSQHRPAEAALDYIALLNRYYPGEPPSFVGLEGYLNARVLVEGLRRAGRDLTREGFIDAIESIRDLRIGESTRISFGPKDHQGMDRVFFTRLQDGRFIPFNSWDKLRACHTFGVPR
ncbi:ABC transporter substrate-binding protein [Desulfovibrio oxyclinae]|jgi:ABC-type branched-subunit amino acid transport system substrate-binding protein|uniref:ABC transporter substrate-binding protein n=1 Tax=Desulfovibrio oxyclinae TaxID=63560 RepID=UPI000379068F